MLRPLWEREVADAHAVFVHDAVVAELRAHGHSSAGLWVIERNERARRLYERNGWTVVDGEVIEELGVREVRYRLDLR